MRRGVFVGALTLVLAVSLFAMASSYPPTAEEEPTPITVTNGSLTVDAGQTFTRLQGLLGTDVEAPREIKAFDSFSDFRNGTTTVSPDGDDGDDSDDADGESDTASLPTFWRYAGFEQSDIVNDSMARNLQNGFTTAFGSVVVFPGENASADQASVVLVHELVHYVQVQQRVQRTLSQELGRTTDERFVQKSLLEGGAVYATDTYLQRFGKTDLLNRELYHRLFDLASREHPIHLSNAPYLLGRSYFDDRLDSPAQLWDAYDDPPKTTEALLHQLPPGSEPPATLSVIVETGPNWTSVADDRLGELFVRKALATTVDPDRAVEAATGWGNDSLRILRPRSPGGDGHFVWLIRFEDRANATEFEDVAGEYVAARNNELQGASWPEATTRFALHRPAERTVALVVGDATFNEAVTLDGDGGAVTLTVAE